MGSLSEHLDDGNDLVRYHLATALAAVGCEYPGRLAAARDPLVERIDDGNEYVRGRAVEALGLLARADEDHPVPERVVGLDDEPSFVADRVAFATGERSAASGTDDAVGTIASIREGTDDVVAEMTAPDDGDCPRCGFALPEDGPPVCPQCGTPR
jgi:hypothetical protein